MPWKATQVGDDPPGILATGMWCRGQRSDRFEIGEGRAVDSQPQLSRFETWTRMKAPVLEPCRPCAAPSAAETYRKAWLTRIFWQPPGQTSRSPGPAHSADEPRSRAERTPAPWPVSYTITVALANRE